MPENPAMDQMDTADASASVDNYVITKDTKDFIKTVLVKIARKQAAYQNFERYYNGDHPVNFASEKFTTQFANRLRTFRDNLCPVCVKAPADRLEVVGFASDKDSPVYKESWRVWQYSEMNRIASRVHRDAFKLGDAFAVVWGDEIGAARIYQQDTATCTVFYDAEDGSIESGAKLWRGNDGYVYLTLYFEDRIEKYVTKSKLAPGNMPSSADAFMHRAVAGESWPLSNPTGVCPMFHFGLESSILTDVIPLNDALNKTIADMLVASESNSLRQRWTTGLAYEINPETGKQIIPFEAASQWYASNDATGKFGEFSNIPLKDFLDVANDFRDEVASIVGIPHYYFRLIKGVLPSGAALTKAESRFVSIIKNAQLDFGSTWAKVMQMAMQIDNIAIPEGSQIETQWTPADSMSAADLAELAGLKIAVGVSEKQALTEMGYTDAQIKLMQSDTAAINKTKIANQTDAFAKTFNAGPQLG